MSRIITVGAAQFGPVSRSETRKDAVERLLALMRQAHERGCDLVVFTEVALTAFFPHWYMEDAEEIDAVLSEIETLNHELAAAMYKDEEGAPGSGGEHGFEQAAASAEQPADENVIDAEFEEA